MLEAAELRAANGERGWAAEKEERPEPEKVAPKPSPFRM